MARNYKMELLSIAIQMGWHGGRALPALLVGVPGTAKTSTVESLGARFTEALRNMALLSEKEAFEVMTIVMPQTAPSTIEGTSVPTNDRTEVNRLPLAHMRKLHHSKFGMIFADELSSAQDETGAAFMALTQDGRAGDLRLSNRIARVAAMNPPDCAAAGRSLSLPECNRFLWIPDWTVPVEDYCDYLSGGEGLLNHVRILPKDWEEKNLVKSRTLLSLFIKTHPNLKNELERMAGAEDSTTQVSEEAGVAESSIPDNGPWGSERSWENYARLLAALFSLDENKEGDLARLAAEGCVGKKCAEAWFDWIRTADFPNPEEMLADPEKAQEWLNAPNQRSDKRKLQLEQVASRALVKSYAQDERIKRWNGAWEVLGPTILNRRDDALGAARMLAKAIPAKECLDNKWFVMVQDLAKDGFSMDSMKIKDA